MHRGALCWVLAILLIGACSASSSGNCDAYTTPALGSNSILPPWSVASGKNEWLTTVQYNPDLVTVQDRLLSLECILDSLANTTYNADNSTFLAGAVKTDVALGYGFVDVSLQTSSNFWETVIQFHQVHADKSFDYIVIGIAPTYIYMSIGVNVGSSSQALLDDSISLQGLFGSSFDSSLAFHNYSVLRTAITCAVFLDGAFVGSFTRSQLNGLWPFLPSGGNVPVYIMQSNLNSRPGENATALVDALSSTSLGCYEVDAGTVNDLDVFFPFGTADFALDAEDAALLLRYSQLVVVNSSTSAVAFVLPVNPRDWNRTSSCSRLGLTCTYAFTVLVNGQRIAATYTVYRKDTTVLLGVEEVKVRSGDFRLDLITPLGQQGFTYRLEAAFDSSTALQANLSANASTTVNVQAGPIAMNISFFEYSSLFNMSSLPRVALARSSNFSSALLIEFPTRWQLTAFFRVAYSDRHRSKFRWWMAVAGVGGFLLLVGCCTVIVVLVARQLRKCLRRRRRREIEMQAAKVVTIA